MRVLDLFSGIGGFSIGLEKAGFETVAFCEIDKKARAVLKKHWPDVQIFEDVSQLTKEKLDEHGISVDVICGGFPCQDISVAGRGAGLEGQRSGLWYEYHRLIKELTPQWVIIENVSALRSRGLDAVLRSLFEIGYDAEWHCIPASAVGAPHRRDRVWVVGYPCCQREYLLFDGGSSQGIKTPSSAGEIHVSNSGGCEHVAYSASERLSERGQPRGQKSGTETLTGMVSESERCGSFTNALRAGLERQWEVSGGVEPEQQDTGNTRWWAVEPDVGRVAYGVRGRVDRLKQLGNAVVPQIPELIGKAIMSVEKEIHNG
jgi:DNA (cytosine-5)-methyltransferase 1